MPLFATPGTGSLDLGNPAIGTVRRDISELLLASLATENNFIGSIQVGEEFVGAQLQWNEDSLNPYYLIDATPGGLTPTSTTMVVSSPAQMASLSVGAILVDETIGDLVFGERVQVTAMSGTSLTITRGYGGTTPVAHASGNVWRIVDRPTYENSDLGPDRSRTQITKVNILARYEENVNLSQEAIIQAKYQYRPGVPNELRYQFEQRLRELLRLMNNAAIYGVPSATGPSQSFSTCGGLMYWLNGQGNTTASPFNANGAVLSDLLINQVNRAIINQGAVPDWIFVGTLGADAISKIYNERIRIVQDDTTRGYKVKEFDTTLQNTLRVLWDRMIFDNTPSAPGTPSTSGRGIVFILDSGRIRIRPYAESLFYTIQAPTLSDGDKIRMLSKWSLEVRNTGTDVGFAHQLVYGLNF